MTIFSHHSREEELFGPPQPPGRHASSRANPPGAQDAWRQATTVKPAAAAPEFMARLKGALTEFQDRFGKGAEAAIMGALQGRDSVLKGAFTMPAQLYINHLFLCEALGRSEREKRDTLARFEAELARQNVRHISRDTVLAVIHRSILALHEYEAQRHALFVKPSEPQQN